MFATTRFEGDLYCLDESDRVARIAELAAYHRSRIAQESAHLAGVQFVSRVETARERIAMHTRLAEKLEAAL